MDRRLTGPFPEFFRLEAWFWFRRVKKGTLNIEHFRVRERIARSSAATGRANNEAPCERCGRVASLGRMPQRFEADGRWYVSRDPDDPDLLLCNFCVLSVCRPEKGLNDGHGET